MTAVPKKDLVVLVADKDMEETVRGLLSRPQSIGMRSVIADVYRHPGRDGGCRAHGVTFLRTFCRQYQHALLMFDREGSGRDAANGSQLEAELEQQLHQNGWQDRAAAIVLEPELEIWVWSDSPEVDRIAGWSGRLPPLRQWLVGEGFLAATDAKPARPKEAFRHALRHVRKQPSPALFREMAAKVSLRRCNDRAFQKLLNTLGKWFPAI